MVEVGFRLSLWIWAQESVLPLLHLPQCRFLLAFASLLGKEAFCFLGSASVSGRTYVLGYWGQNLISDYALLPRADVHLWSCWFLWGRKLPVSSSGEKDFFVPLSLASKGLHFRPEGLQLCLPPHPQCLLFIRSLFLSGWFVWPQESSSAAFSDLDLRNILWDLWRKACEGV